MDAQHRQHGARHSLGQKGRIVDLETALLRHNHVLVQTSSVAHICVGLGAQAARLQRFAFTDTDDPEPFFSECRRVADSAVPLGQITRSRSGILRALSELDDPRFRRLAIPEALIKAGYNPFEPRRHGEWARAGDSAGATAAGTARALPVSVRMRSAEGTADDDHAPASPDDPAPNPPSVPLFVDDREKGILPIVRNLLEKITPETLKALALLGARFSAPTAFLGIVFLPLDSGSVISGTMPDRPDISYHYDGPAGSLTFVQDGKIIAIGYSRNDTPFLDKDGHVLAVRAGKDIVIDPSIFPKAANEGSGIGVKARSQTDEDEPKVCPNPEYENPEGRSPDAIVYQMEITGLDPELAVFLTDPRTGNRVSFDGCCVRNPVCTKEGNMLEAKDYYSWAMKNATDFNEWFTKIKAIKHQMCVQNRTAGAAGRMVEWHCSEAVVADYLREYASKKGFKNTIVIHTPRGQ